MLAALMYGLGLSCSAASHLLLGALGAQIGKTSVWPDAQEAGEALREKRPAGKARVLGADETVFKLKGKEVVVGFVVDGVSGKTLGFEVLLEGDGRAFREWLEPYATEMGAQVIISDDNDSYGMAAAELGLSHQLCVAHVRASTSPRGPARSWSKPKKSGTSKTRGSKSSPRTSRSAEGATRRTPRGRRPRDRAVAPRVPVGCSTQEERARRGEGSHTTAYRM